MKRKLLLKILVIVMLLTACKTNDAEIISTKLEANEEASPRVFRYGLGASWESLNPYYTVAGGLYAGLVCDKIYDKLFFIHEDGKRISPRNAESWNMSNNQKTMTIKLNKNAKWHDGRNVTANDWKYTFDLLADPDFPYDNRKNMYVFVGTDHSGRRLDKDSLGIKVIDDYTLELNLKESWNDKEFVSVWMKKFVVLPEHILGSLESKEVMDSEFWNSPIGSGPCIFEGQMEGSYIDLQINKEYHMGVPNFDKVRMQVINGSNVVTAYLVDELDFSFPFLSVESAEMAKAEGLNVIQSENANKLVMLLINNQNVPEPKLRKAINLAIDKELMVNQVMKGHAEVAESYILPNSEFLNHDLPKGRDLETARLLLEEINYDFARKYIIAVPKGFRLQLASILQANLQEIGINLEIEMVDTPTMFSGIKDGKYDFAIMADTMTEYPLCAEWYFDNEAANYCAVTDPQYKKAMTDIKNTVDSEARIKKIKEFQALLYDTEPLIPLYFQYNFTVKSGRLTGINHFDAYMFNDAIWEWGLN